MYGLPENYDTSFLKGKEVESVCFARYQVNVNFEGGVWIQIESGYRIVSQCEDLEVVMSFPAVHSVFPTLLGVRVVDVATSAAGDMEIRFDGGLALRLTGDSGPYESYRIFDGVREVIV